MYLGILAMFEYWMVDVFASISIIRKLIRRVKLLIVYIFFCPCIHEYVYMELVNVKVQQHHNQRKCQRESMYII